MKRAKAGLIGEQLSVNYWCYGRDRRQTLPGTRVL